MRYIVRRTPFDRQLPEERAVQEGNRWSETRRTLTELSTIGLFVLALLVALHAAASMVVPMVAAIIVGSVVAHAGDRGQRIGIPPMVAGLALTAVLGAGMFLLIEAIAEPISALVERLPQVLPRLAAAFGDLLAPFTTLQARLTGGNSLPDGGVASLEKMLGSLDLGVVASFLGGLTPAFGEFLIFLATLVFYVAGRAQLRRQSILAFVGREERLAAIRIFNATEASLTHYFGTTSVIYAGVGLATGLIAMAAGLPAPVLWGLFAFAMSFVPFLGPAVVSLAIASGGLLLDYGMLSVLWPVGAFMTVHLICENAVVPAVLGRRFEINPFLVFVSIIFWTWMWGAIGAVLAVPMLLIARTIRSEFKVENRASLPS
ncbi:putative transmembrane protein [uncultured Pleomorphomonas sp.]|uniref:Putative transmembrane protein n=1 Tax=uncultured Pleomorphomonas sp. TaxID=442121 RepID=A0A212LEI7_9HYPH|nr:AI-2E family transporter [uncultured Pleomorphomonas sp.]SCM75789.1 putative transmembrane protein [uncultured Pleomorphomonas sp.]